MSGNWNHMTLEDEKRNIEALAKYEMEQVKKFCVYWNDGINVKCSFPLVEGHHVECTKACNVYISIKKVLDNMEEKISQNDYEWEEKSR